MEFTLLWAALTAVVFGWVGLQIWSERLPEHASDRLIAATLAGLVAGRLTAMLVQGINPVTNPGDFIIVRGGVDTGVATTVFIVSLLWGTRRNAGAIDAMAPAVLFALAGWHAGCLWRGACLGTASDLPWAWAQTGSDVTRHPVEIYTALGLALGAYVVSRLGWQRWLRAGVALAVASAVRLLTEPLRPSITGGPVGWYVAGLVVGLLAATLGRRLTPADHPAPT
ncbi:MAG: prolipoprotein diacylglyceryl transferase [Acidimicrobiia bacterium]|jgi:prolipoprotein diacylglyceryltransferase